jgi:hypothetical protein
MRAGDGGGLLLAFVLYPLFLATIQHGAKGPGMWFRAKWLNNDNGLPNTGGPAVHTPGDQNSPRPVPGQRYYVIDPKTGKYQLVDSNGKPIAGAPEQTKLPPGSHLYPGAGGTPA